ncbi:hypothetical protein MD484_g3739, partial [Candolleomyces efflorescens]
MPPQSTYFSGAHHFQINHPAFNSIAGNQYVIASQREDLNHRLDPILDASHTRNRNTSPPDSECFPGTRVGVIDAVKNWADEIGSELDSLRGTRDEPEFSFHIRKEEQVMSSDSAGADIPHIYWLHGFAGCGKSAVSLEVARIYARSGRLLASYFFFRGAGDRSTMRRFAATLASQLVAAIPATAPYVEAAMREVAGLLTNHVSLATQLDRLVLMPFQSAVDEGALIGSGPFLIVIDGLDECEDQRGVEELIDHLINFFEEHPTSPLRVFIASRVEQHIRERLEVDGVLLDNLDSHVPDEDIKRFLRISFQRVAKQDRVIRAYVREHGEWPTVWDMNLLINHIGGSFVLASTMFKSIVHSPTHEDPTTPMERLPLTLELNGLDALYSQTLARSQHLPHFKNIISTIVLLERPLPIAEISNILGLKTFEVVRVLLNLQAILHVPGTDEKGEVTLCHTSLRDFLTTESRSGSFFVPPSFHLDLSYYCFSSIIERNIVHPSNDYCWRNFDDHHWDSFAESRDCDFLAEIERFKAHPPLVSHRINYHAFLFSMFFYTMVRSSRLNLPIDEPFVAEWANQLVLAVECASPDTKRWLEQPLHYETYLASVPFTEHMYETLKQALERASAAIRANFPGIVESHPPPTAEEKTVTVNFAELSGIKMFNTLQWMLARAHSKISIKCISDFEVEYDTGSD